MTVPTPQRNQVFFDLVHQGRQPGIGGIVDVMHRDVGHVIIVERVSPEGNILRQHVGCEGRRRELVLLQPYD